MLRRSTGSVAALAVGVLLLLCGCEGGGGSASSAGATAGSGGQADPAPEPDRGDGWPPGADDPLVAALREAAERHGGGMVPEGPLLRGELPAGRWVEEAVVLRAGRCYRVVAVGGGGVRDLDAMLVDPHGEPVTHDGMVGPVAVLGQHESICLADAGLFRLRLKAFEGSGSYRARLLRRPLQ